MGAAVEKVVTLRGAVLANVKAGCLRLTAQAVATEGKMAGRVPGCPGRRAPPLRPWEAQRDQRRANPLPVEGGEPHQLEDNAGSCQAIIKAQPLVHLSSPA